MSWQESTWRIALSVARPLVEAGARSGRAGRAVRGRRESLPRLETWAVRGRDRARPLVWVHAPSVGEALMAEAIIAAVRARVDAQIAFTFFSPSAERVADRVGADVSAYLPWDVPRDVRRALAWLEPAAVAFIRTEIWPTLVREAKAHGARVALLNAPLAGSSSRLRPIARRLLRPSYAALDAVGAVAEEDAALFGRLGVPAGRVHVTGDARFDQAWARASTIDENAPLLQRLREPGRATIVAGSTWPADEARLVPAFAELRRSRACRLLVAPHEPSARHLSGLERRLETAGLVHARLAAVEAGGPPLPEVVIVDRVGVLATLYAAGQVAYVGGGFGARGLHSVIEPAATGRPVAFGPRHGHAREAAALVKAGGGAVVEDAAALAERLSEWLESGEAGRFARAFVESRLGGADRNALLLLERTSLRGERSPPVPGDVRNGRGIRD